MQTYLNFADRIEHAILRVLGDQPIAQPVLHWCDTYKRQCASIEESRGMSMASVAIVGAKGQGKTWVARQFVLDEQLAETLPSGVLSSEATTKIYWVGPMPPEGLDPEEEVYLPCRQESLLDLRIPYVLLDTPGLTDDNPRAAKIAREALTLSPVKLLVVRRDQMRGAILGKLALYTEGAICIPVINCVPPNELQENQPKAISGEKAEHNTQSIAYAKSAQTSRGFQEDLRSFERALRSVAPGTKFLRPILVEDFESTGMEHQASTNLKAAIQERLLHESLEQIAATKVHRLEAVKERLRSRVSQYVTNELSDLAEAVKRLHREADILPSETLQTVLGSQSELQAAIRGRIRAHVLNETGLLWFPYRTVLFVLSFTTGAWDRLVLSFTGSLPSIFGTFLAWAKNIRSGQGLQRDLEDGIRVRLNRQIADRLQPIQASFYRSIQRLGGAKEYDKSLGDDLKLRLTGIDELQSRARSVFEWCVDRHLPSRFKLQVLGMMGTLIFWGMMLGPIVAVYRKYFHASWDTLVLGYEETEKFEVGSGIILGSVVLSALPLLIYTMIAISWILRSSKVRTVAAETTAAEKKLLSDLRNDGVIRLQYEDPLLEEVEFLVKL